MIPRKRTNFDSRSGLYIRSLLYALLISVLCSQVSFALETANAAPASEIKVPILLYHRFGNSVPDNMTITNQVFESHLKYLKENGYTVVPLQQLVDFMNKKPVTLPAKPVAIVVDDGHKTVYSDLQPLVKRYNIPVTLFIYPSAISNARYAMTWAQLKELNANPLFDIQSHTYWHPNFKTDRKKMPQDEFTRAVEHQLKKSKQKLEKELNKTIDKLAWPFGIYDDYLTQKAREAGYVATFTIERHHVSSADDIMKLPRYLLLNSDQGETFAQILNGSSSRKKQ